MKEGRGDNLKEERAEGELNRRVRTTLPAVSVPLGSRAVVSEAPVTHLPLLPAPPASPHSPKVSLIKGRTGTR
ncbi:hypothetical protein E2C01_067666 [Portunus trituberculatus]|uniref:Uncharacterized protein n=1 Tax=Portunus trituberculatus TaxID=210409 RepID=A0A5B7HPY4_PORTR|nr:hypothetical protein [Portunus trituberculatus]